MIVSFHPLFEADKNIICAGREPTEEDLAAIKAADAVILSQGCYQSLYELARSNCPNVFPNYDTRFKYPGKTGQIKLFRDIQAPHPASIVYSNIALFEQHNGKGLQKLSFKYPFVFKLDWGGEGETVYLVKSAQDLQKILINIAEFEKAGQSGFLLQEFILSAHKTLRVVVIGQRLISYWRIQQNTAAFHSNLCKGAVIDFDSEPELQQKAVALVKRTAEKAKINLAGFDVIFSSESHGPAPMFLEINHFFGRRGLGGSQAYYQMLRAEIHRWLVDLNLNLMIQH
jgi:ribosomal protein S6--L-glutamate ligase